MTVAWVHFFAEGYYSALMQVPLLMLLGVEPGMPRFPGVRPASTSTSARTPLATRAASRSASRPA